MKHVKTLNSSTLKESMKKGGCGECQTSCQSACKTSCTVGNQIVCRNMRQMSEKTPTVVRTVGVTSLVCPKLVYGVKISLRQGEHFSDSSIYQ